MIRLSDIVRDPQITSGYGEVREFSTKPHTGIDVVSGIGDRFLRAPFRPGQMVWQYNITSPLRVAAQRVYDRNGSEWAPGWMYADTYGMIGVWFDEDSDLALILCHMEPFQSADIASHHGVHLWEHRTRYQTRYDGWHEFYGNVTKPGTLMGGELIGVYSDTGKSIGAHLHLEVRRMEIGTDTRGEWETLDPLDHMEV